MAENFDVFDFELSAAELAAIDALTERARPGERAPRRGQLAAASPAGSGAGAMERMPNRLGVDQPVPAFACRQPRRLVRLGEEAFAEARDRDVPVLVSIGYSTCHWCHVMARESFSDPEVAAYSQ